MRFDIKGDVYVCDVDEKEKEYDKLLFQKIKIAMLKMCNEHIDIPEYKLFKEKLEQATSFEDFNKN